MTPAARKVWLKVLAAAACLGLAAALHWRGLDVASVARAVLLAAAVAGGWSWWRRRAPSAGSGRPEPRLTVVSRAPLGARSGVALLAVDGETYLVVHGEGFAQLRRASPRRAARRGPRTHELTAVPAALRKMVGR